MKELLSDTWKKQQKNMEKYRSKMSLQLWVCFHMAVQRMGQRQTPKFLLSSCNIEQSSGNLTAIISRAEEAMQREVSRNLCRCSPLPTGSFSWSPHVWVTSPRDSNEQLLRKSICCDATTGTNSKGHTGCRTWVLRSPATPWKYREIRQQGGQW